MTIFNGNTHYKWPFSIAMLNYQRVRWPISAMGCVPFSATPRKMELFLGPFKVPVRKKNALRGSTSWGSTQLGNKVRIPLGYNRSYRWININPTYPTCKWIITPHLQSGISRKAIMRFRQCLVVRELI